MLSGQYEELKANYADSKRQNEDLKERLAVTKGELEGSRHAYEELLRQIPRTSNSGTFGPGSTYVPLDLTELDKTIPRTLIANCQQAKYYFKSEFETVFKAQAKETVIGDKVKGKAKDSDDNVTAWYITDLKGQPVSGRYVDDIRKHARAIWWQFHAAGIAPMKWSQASLTTKKAYEAELCTKFPELTYGENNWKAHQVATDNYPNWYKKNIRSKGLNGSTVKTEPIAPEIKRKLESPPAEMPTSKRARSENQEGADNYSLQLIEDPLFDLFASTKEAPLPLSSPPLASPTASQQLAPKLFTTHQELTTPLTARAIVDTTTEPTLPPSLSRSSRSRSSFLAVPLAPHASHAPHAPPCNDVATPTNVVVPVQPKNTRKPRRATAGPGNNPKAICKRAWVLRNPTAIELDFKAYWNTEITPAEKAVFIGESENLVAELKGQA
ncbi:hypothetical protein BDN71DRAFT_1587417 [Pleurotus eryngii]|uniref:Uncharacterized protein n=1 Tax=Pleurotus eryngii TaxID=5323 RepID=A0A9P6D9Q1_PLEER|nr:hypothetical protein BDN71DRAFT_1587417 [Pleurotus eryngii]